MRPDVVQDIIERCSFEMASSLRCLNGDSYLVALKVNDCEIDICPSCHSLWLDPGEVEKLANCFRDSSALLAAHDLRSRSASKELEPLCIIDVVFQLLTILIR